MKCLFILYNFLVNIMYLFHIQRTVSAEILTYLKCCRLTCDTQEDTMSDIHLSWQLGGQRYIHNNVMKKVINVLSMNQENKRQHALAQILHGCMQRKIW